MRRLDRPGFTKRVQRDPLASLVSLDLRFGGPLGATFTDSGPLARTVTANGNAQIAASSQWCGGSSGLFDGTGDYLQLLTDPSMEVATAEFCLEMVFMLGAAGIAAVLWDSNTGLSFYAYDLTTNTSNKLIFQGFDAVNGLVYSITGNTALVAGQVYHVACTRWLQPGLAAGTSRYNLWLNGRDDAAPVTSATALRAAGDPVTIGAQGGGGATAVFNGQIFAARFTKGAPRYTQPFAPPIGPLPVA